MNLKSIDIKHCVHIMPDSHLSFSFIRELESYERNKSTYFILVKSDLKKEVSLSLYKNAHYLKDTKVNYSSLIDVLKPESNLILHSFYLHQYKFILEAKKKKATIYWLFWGFEGYKAIHWNYNLNQFFNRTKQSPLNIKEIILNFYFALNDRLVTKKIIDLIDYCCTWVDEDFKAICKVNPDIKHLYYNYYTKSNLKINFAQLHTNNTNTILLGNSADPTGLHIEMLQYLKKNYFKGKIICPLSYGGTVKYISKVKDLGYKFFGENFYPLNEKLPEKEYTQLINTCNIFWFNHKRQQAAGNIFIGFLLNKIVILNNKSILKKELTSKGFLVYDNFFLFKNNWDNLDYSSNNIKALSVLSESNNYKFYDKIISD